jgi:hypothetical protein
MQVKKASAMARANLPVKKRRRCIGTSELSFA